MSSLDSPAFSVILMLGAVVVCVLTVATALTYR